jgi:hypothetical protein
MEESGSVQIMTDPDPVDPKNIRIRIHSTDYDILYVPCLRVFAPTLHRELTGLIRTSPTVF